MLDPGLIFFFLVAKRRKPPGMIFLMKINFSYFFLCLILICSNCCLPSVPISFNVTVPTSNFDVSTYNTREPEGLHIPITTLSGNDTV